MERRPAQLAQAVVDSLPSEVAALDASGMISWANAAWSLAASGETTDILAGAAIGVDFITKSRAAGTTVGDAITNGVAGVIAGALPSFRTELGASDGSRRWRLQVNPLRAGVVGAVVMRTEITPPESGPLVEPPDSADVRARIAQLTPRERDVLRLMVRGLSNREIAAELGVEYTTVRSHTQAIIEKLAARSRLQAAALAHRAGFIE